MILFLTGTRIICDVGRHMLYRWLAYYNFSAHQSCKSCYGLRDWYTGQGLFITYLQGCLSSGDDYIG